MLSLLPLLALTAQAMPFGTWSPSPSLPPGITVSSPAVVNEFKVYAQLSQLTYCAATYPTSYPCFSNNTCRAFTPGILPYVITRLPYATPDHNYEGYVSVDQDKQAILFGFRGSADTANLLEALEFLPVPYQNPHDPAAKVHYGFISTYEAFADQIRDAITKARNAHPGFKINGYGHSFGCALAQLTAVDIVFNLGIDPSTIQLTGFGCPRVGNINYARLLDQTLAIPFRRVVHSDDLVVHCPTLNLGYNHAGVEYWIDVNSKQMLECKDIDPTTNESPSCSLSVPPILFSIDAHRSYFNCINACLPANGTTCAYLPFEILTKH